MQIHRVRENENIYDIAREYGVSPIKIAENNEVDIKGRLAIGRELLILMPTRTYNVRRGDTLDAIYKRFGCSPRTVKALNPELYSSDGIYQGQILSIKYDTPTYGMGVANGYYYSGCPKDKLKRAIPYMSYITVCSARSNGQGKIDILFDDSELITLAKKNRIIPLLRIYVADADKLGTAELIRSASILATSKGYMGITLPSRLQKLLGKEECCNIKRELIDCGLQLFFEGSIDEGGSDTSDGCVLTYDKIHLDDIPSFNEGEERVLREYADSYDSMSSFIDLSPFAYSDGKYIDKGTALAICDKNRAVLEYDKERAIIQGELGRGRRARQMRCESLENTKAKLRLIGELGYMGISFDIMRAQLSELLMFTSMFSMAPVSVGAPKCNS